MFSIFYCYRQVFINKINFSDKINKRNIHSSDIFKSWQCSIDFFMHYTTSSSVTCFSWFVIINAYLYNSWSLYFLVRSVWSFFMFFWRPNYSGGFIAAVHLHIFNRLLIFCSLTFQWESQFDHTLIPLVFFPLIVH